MPWDILCFIKEAVTIIVYYHTHHQVLTRIAMYIHIFTDEDKHLCSLNIFRNNFNEKIPCPGVSENLDWICHPHTCNFKIQLDRIGFLCYSISVPFSFLCTWRITSAIECWVPHFWLEANSLYVWSQVMAIFYIYPVFVFIMLKLSQY